MYKVSIKLKKETIVGECWQEHTHPGIQSPMRMTRATAITSTAATSSSYLNNISLDGKTIGYVTGEEDEY
jgi:hypothetical protein